MAYEQTKFLCWFKAHFQNTHMLGVPHLMRALLLGSGVVGLTTSSSSMVMLRAGAAGRRYARRASTMASIAPPKPLASCVDLTHAYISAVTHTTEPPEVVNGVR